MKRSDFEIELLNELELLFGISDATSAVCELVALGLVNQIFTHFHLPKFHYHFFF